VLLESGIFMVFLETSVLLRLKSTLKTCLSGGSIAKEPIVTESLLLPPQEILSSHKVLR